MARENAVRERSYEFALEIVALYRALAASREYVLGRQLLRSGTSIGANVEEAQAAQSRADFVSKLHIALKEARECHYWLRLIRDSGLAPHDVTPLLARSEQLIGLLTTIIRTTRSNPNP